MLERLFKLNDDLTTIHILNETDDFNIVEFCVAYNFDKRTLPKVLGGIWMQKSFKEWRKKQILLENSIPKTLDSPLMEKRGISLFNDATLAETRDVVLDNGYHRKQEQTSSECIYLIDALPSLVTDEDKDEFFLNLMQDDLFDDASFMSIHSGIFDSC